MENMNDATPQEVARFKSKTKPAGDCILWTGQLDRYGYGVLNFRRATRKAHRLALWFANRPIPEGHVVNHTCRNRHCVNPQHLNTLTASENSKRDSTSVGYINSQKTHCKEGHPFDRFYGGQRYCSICDRAKGKRLRAKWRAEGIMRI
jgi:hypothetical protein